MTLWSVRSLRPWIRQVAKFRDRRVRSQRLTHRLQEFSRSDAEAGDAFDRVKKRSIDDVNAVTVQDVNGADRKGRGRGNEHGVSIVLVFFDDESNNEAVFDLD